MHSPNESNETLLPNQQSIGQVWRCCEKELPGKNTSNDETGHVFPGNFRSPFHVQSILLTTTTICLREMFTQA